MIFNFCNPTINKNELIMQLNTIINEQHGYQYYVQCKNSYAITYRMEDLSHAYIKYKLKRLVIKYPWTYKYRTPVPELQFANLLGNLLTNKFNLKQKHRETSAKKK